jgi:hypothetical protein
VNWSCYVKGRYEEILTFESMFANFKPLLLLFLLFPLFYYSHAQSGPDDSAVYRSALNNTINSFYASSKSVCTCLHGKEYIASPFSFSEGSPYFLEAGATGGTLLYDHVFYDGVHLLYDELQDELVFVDESHRVMLLTEKIEHFSILDHQFIKMGEQGFFELLYEGNSTLLKREEKTIRKVNSFSTEDRVIDTRPVYYIRKEDHLVRIEGKESLIKIWGNYEKEISAFIKHNKIKFRKELDSDYARVTAFCDQLSPVK